VKVHTHLAIGAGVTAAVGIVTDSEFLLTNGLVGAAIGSAIPDLDSPRAEVRHAFDHLVRLFTGGTLNLDRLRHRRTCH